MVIVANPLPSLWEVDRLSKEHTLAPARVLIGDFLATQSVSLTLWEWTALVQPFHIWP